MYLFYLFLASLQVMKTEKGTKNKFSHFRTILHQIFIQFLTKLKGRNHVILNQISFNFEPNFIQFSIKNSFNFWYFMVQKAYFNFLSPPHKNNSYLNLFCLFSASLQVIEIKKGTKNKFSPISPFSFLYQICSLIS